MRRKIPIFKVNLPPGMTYNAIAQIPEIVEVVLDETVFAIKEGINRNKKSISLFEVANTEYYIELKKDKWKPSLEKALEYYIKKEEYKKCAECRDLINQL